MKRICTTITALLLVVLGLSASTTPGNPSTGLFRDDLKSFEQDFTALNQLEQTVQATGKDYNQLKSENNQALNALNFNGDVSNALLGSSGGDERLAGIPGFLWGFCLGWVGILLVYLLIEDDASKKSQGRKAIVGCIVSGLISIVFYVLWVASLMPQ
jgi:hypothetical protein